jgi:hypothetical protein
VHVTSDRSDVFGTGVLLRGREVGIVTYNLLVRMTPQRLSLLADADD